MKKYIAFILLIASALGFSQKNNSWKGYFSYNEIKDITQSPNQFIAASENALFSKDLATNTIKTTNTIDGLSGQTISAIIYSPSFNKTIIGHENGLITIINEADGTIKNVVDILLNNVDQNLKHINHLMEYQGIIYVSCDFGIVQYNLSKNGFGDTYRIGDFGSEIKVTQTTINDGYIFASTATGIKRALISNPNLIDYNQWSQINSGSWSQIVSINNQILAISNIGEVFKYNGVDFSGFSNLNAICNDMRVIEDYLIITTTNNVLVYNQNLVLLATINNYQMADNLQLTCATIIANELFIGTSSSGVYSTLLSNPTSFESMNPDGPERNNIFSINASTNQLWAVYGDYSSDFNPYPLSYYGISKFKHNKWLNMPYKDVHFSDIDATDLVRVTVNPKNESQLFVSSYHSGLLKFENDILVKHYDETNSGLESLKLSTDPSYVSVRIEQSAFDKNGNLWLTNGLIANGLKVLKTNGQWQSYNMTSVLDSYFDSRLGKLLIDKNGTKWIASITDGLIAFNENGNKFKKIAAGTDVGNLPINDVRAIAIDNNNQVWIGTRKGLRVLSSVDRFLNSGQLTTNSIIILEDGLAQELMYEQYITDIVVDGANNKWIATADSGVFMVSDNGQQTLQHFTIANSPLPSNTINDIDINGETGEVFIATDKGMVSFKGIATTANNDLNNVIVYPNPVRPEYQGTVKISGLLNKCNVKIADISGNLVYETFSEGGTIEWDTTAFGKYKVASGVYMIFISAQDGGETKVEKIMIVR